MSGVSAVCVERVDWSGEGRAIATVRCEYEARYVTYDVSAVRCEWVTMGGLTSRL